MPGRNDKRPKVPKVGEQTVLETSTTSNPIATADQDMVAAVVAVCAMSRGEDASHVLLPSQKRVRAFCSACIMRLDDEERKHSQRGPGDCVSIDSLARGRWCRPCRQRMLHQRMLHRTSTRARYLLHRL